MRNNPDANTRPGDFNSPAFYLVGAVSTRTRVHNFTADLPCDVDDALAAKKCKHVNKYKLILAASLGASSTMFPTLTKNSLCLIPFFPG